MGRYLTAPAPLTGSYTKETFQNTTTPLGFQAGNDALLKIDLTNSKLHASAINPIPGPGAVVIDKSIIADIVSYLVKGIFDHYADYTVLLCTKTLLSTGVSTTVWMLYKASTQQIQDIPGGANVCGAVINGDGYLYTIISTGTASGTTPQAFQAQMTVRPLSNLATLTATVTETGFSIGQSTGGVSSNTYQASSLLFSRKADATGYIVVAQSGTYSNGNGASLAITATCGAVAFAMKAAASTATTLFAHQASSVTSGNGTITTLEWGYASGGVVVRSVPQPYSSGLNTTIGSITFKIMLDETGEIGTTSAVANSFSLSVTGGAVVKQSSKLAYIVGNNGGGSAVMSGSANVGTFSMAGITDSYFATYGASKIIGGDFKIWGVDLSGATPAITYLKQLAAIPGGVKLPQHMGLAHKFFVIGQAVNSGNLYYLHTLGVNVDAADPPIYFGNEYDAGSLPIDINTNAVGAPCAPGYTPATGGEFFQSAKAYTATAVRGFRPGYNTALTSLEANGIAWAASTAGKLYLPWKTSGNGIKFKAEGLGDATLHGFNQFFYNDTSKAAIKLTAAADGVGFAKFTTTVVLPAYTNTATVPITIKLRINDLTTASIRSLRIVNQPAQSVSVIGNNLLSINLAPGVNLVSEDVVLEGEFFYNLTLPGAALLLSATTGLPITSASGTIMVQNSALATRTRSMQEYYA